MTAAFASERPHDRICDWLEELALVREVAASLPAAARAAVLDALQDFEEEDGVLSQEAIHTRAVLIAGADPPTRRGRRRRLSRPSSLDRCSNGPTPIEPSPARERRSSMRSRRSRSAQR
jgi:hypothetical protein